MSISTIKAMRNFLCQNSGFSERTINNAITALGFSLNGTGQDFIELSSHFENCAEHGADCGFSGFIYYKDTIAFFRKHRVDIASHMERTAAELGTDIFSMVQNFGVFRNSEKPSVGEIGKALWDGSQFWPEFTNLYNVYAWYALEEISRTWYRYLEDNPDYWAKLTA